MLAVSLSASFGISLPDWPVPTFKDLKILIYASTSMISVVSLHPPSGIQADFCLDTAHECQKQSATILVIGQELVCGGVKDIGGCGPRHRETCG